MHSIGVLVNSHSIKNYSIFVVHHMHIIGRAPTCFASRPRTEFHLGSPEVPMFSQGIVSHELHAELTI